MHSSLAAAAVACVVATTPASFRDDVGGRLNCNNTNPVNHSKTVVAFVGDSITYGFTCETFRGGFAKVVSDLLPAEQFEVRDCGIVATTASQQQHVEHPSYWGTIEHNISRQMKPDVVIFMLGTNDASEWGPQVKQNSMPARRGHCGADCGNSRLTFEDDYTQLLSSYQDLVTTKGGKPRVVTMIPPPDGNWTNATFVNPPRVGVLPVVPQPCPQDPMSECPSFVNFVNCSDGTHPNVAQCQSSMRFYSNVPQQCIINCVFPSLLPTIWDKLQIDGGDRVDLETFMGGPDKTDKQYMPSLHPNCDGYEKIGRHIATQIFGH